MLSDRIRKKSGSFFYAFFQNYDISALFDFYVLDYNEIYITRIMLFTHAFNQLRTPVYSHGAHIKAGGVR